MLDEMLDVRGKGGKNGSAVLGLMERKDGVVIYWDGERMQVERVLG